VTDTPAGGAAPKPSVLVVDDEAGMRETLVEILRDAGYRVDAAPDGDSALAHLRAQPCDIVVMDVRMPGRDGVSVLQELNAPPPQVILMTAFAMEERLQEAVRSRAFAIMHKPFAPPRLLDLMAEAVA
jgi:two-component system chemotaxis response regulator CheY